MLIEVNQEEGLKMLPDTLLIEVTQNDIDFGCARDKGNCPIAKAAKRAIPEGYGVEVGNYMLTILNGFYGVALREYWLPEDAKQFVFDFDEELKVSPISFTLDEGNRDV
jgi:hypothetical protein